MLSGFGIFKCRFCKLVRFMIYRIKQQAFNIIIETSSVFRSKFFQLIKKIGRQTKNMGFLFYSYIHIDII